MPAGTLETIIEYRAYAQAKSTYDRRTPQTKLPESPMIDLVKAIDFTLAREAIAAHE